MIWGVNIHRTYGLPFTTQLALIANLRIRSIRVDVYDAKAETLAWLNSLIMAAEARGISVLPVIVPNAAASNTEANAYDWGYANGRALSLAFPTLTWEAGNELDMYCGKPGNTGESMSHFDTARYQQCRGSIRGMYAGIKSGSSSAQVGVGMAGVHWGFLDLLKRDDVQWDITTWHIYITTDTSSASIASGAKAYFARLAAYGRPIMVTEFNQQDGHLSTQDPRTLLDMMTGIETSAAQRNILAAYLYELLDEPHLSGGEATYGIASAAGIPNSLSVAVRQRLS